MDGDQANTHPRPHPLPLTPARGVGCSPAPPRDIPAATLRRPHACTRLPFPRPGETLLRSPPVPGLRPAPQRRGPARDGAGRAVLREPGSRPAAGFSAGFSASATRAASGVIQHFSGAGLGQLRPLNEPPRLPSALPSACTPCRARASRPACRGAGTPLVYGHSRPSPSPAAPRPRPAGRRGSLRPSPCPSGSPFPACPGGWGAGPARPAPPVPPARPVPPAVPGWHSSAWLGSPRGSRAALQAAATLGSVRPPSFLRRGGARGPAPGPPPLPPAGGVGRGGRRAPPLLRAVQSGPEPSSARGGRSGPRRSRGRERPGGSAEPRGGVGREPQRRGGGRRGQSCGAGARQPQGRRGGERAAPAAA